MLEDARVIDINKEELQFGDFYYHNYGNKYPLLALCIYEGKDMVYVISSVRFGCYFNYVKSTQFINDEQCIMRRLPKINDKETYFKRKKQVLTNMENIFTNLEDIFYYLLLVDHCLASYHSYLNSIYKIYYQQLFHYFREENAYVPPFIYDHRCMRHLVLNSTSFKITEDIKLTTLAKYFRNILRTQNLSNQQRIHINNYCEYDAAIPLCLDNSWWNFWL
jgi:hypothetical protein